MNGNKLTCLILSVGMLALTGCPSGGGIPGRGGGAAASSVDPNSCGNYAASDVGRKLRSFLRATVRLDREVQKTENWVKDTCIAMGAKMGVTGLTGTTKETCDKVLAELRNSLTVGLKPNAKLKIDYQPAVCTVDVQASAQVAAKCEAKASADVQVRCTGQCTGTCNGTCQGECSGSGTAGTGGAAGSGQCNGECKGTCEGSCSGGCDGSADVQASAECKAEAEVQASFSAKCTEPTVTVTYPTDIVVDTSKIDAAKAAIEMGLPRMLKIAAHIGGPVKRAALHTVTTGSKLAAAGFKLYKSLGDQAKCVAGQIKAAVAALAGVKVSIEVQVEVSASASASAGGSGGASGGAGASGGTAMLKDLERLQNTLDATFADAPACTVKSAELH